MKVLNPQIITTAFFFFLIGFFISLNPSTAKGAELDAATKQCISCHEKGLNPKVVFHGEGSDHLIGLDYAKLAKGDHSLIPPSKLNPGLHLDHGRIGCLTCHVPYDKTNHLILAKKRAAMSRDSDPMLSISNIGSGLCMACHQK